MIERAVKILTVKRTIQGADGTITELVVEAEKADEANKPKAFIHWVAKPVTVQVRLYERL